jgi:hypothetical protein
LLGTFLTLAGGPTTVHASETPAAAPAASSNATARTNEPPGPVPWSLRAEGIMTWDGPGVGVSASRVIARNFAVDGCSTDFLGGLFCTNRFEPGRLAPRPRLAIGHSF